MTSAEALKRWRIGTDLTQEEVAASVGVSHAAVSQWENGRTQPRRAVAMKLDGLFGAGGELLRELGYAPPEATPPDDEVAELRRRLDELQAQVAELTATVAALGAALAPSTTPARRARA